MMAGGALYLRQLELGPMQNFVYLIGCAQTKQAMVVDPGWEAETIADTLQRDGMRLSGILLTHHHFDHVGQASELLKRFDVPVYAQRDELSWLPPFGDAVRPLSPGDTVPIGDVAVQCLHTPGHTPGSQCFAVRDCLVAGDTLFIGGCGRCDLPGGDPEAMYKSLTGTLARLDETTVLYPGHNYAETPTSTVGVERRANPYLACSSLGEFLRLMGVS